MLNNYLKIIYFISIILFLYFVVFTYFSNENISQIKNKFITDKKNLDLKINNLPIIKNDTNDIIIYNSDEFLEKKIKKRKIWELLK